MRKVSRKIIKQPGVKDLPKKKAVKKTVVKKVTKKKKISMKKVVVDIKKGLRVTKSGVAKRIQLSNSFKKVLERHPTLIKDFLDIYGKVRVFGFAQKGALRISHFDSRDESTHHDRLFKVSVRGKNLFFVKRVNFAVPPTDAVSQYNLHLALKSSESTLKNWGCKILNYEFAYNGRGESFLVAPFKEGIVLDNWLKKNPKNKGNGVYQRFLKIERFLNSAYNVRDLSPRNVIYNVKKDELIVIDLMPGK